jgi:hypothetical protein
MSTRHLFKIENHMTINREELIDDLLDRAERAAEKVKAFKYFTTEELNAREVEGRWSVLECIEHLNLYGDFYIPEIESRILKQQPSPAATVFRSGIMGNYFAGLMQVRDGRITKMSSPANKNPIGSELSATTLDRFLKQHDRLRTLLEESRSIDLTKTRSAISISRWITLRLGDTLRFFVYHIERHVLQAENTMLKIRNGTKAGFIEKK